MSRKLVVPPFKDPKFSAADMSASITGTPSNIQFTDNIGVQLFWTGGNPIGTITFQVSIDYNANSGSGTWSTIQSSPGTDLTVTPSGSAGNTYVDFNQLSAPWIRVIYTTAGGSSGNLTATIGAKEV